MNWASTATQEKAATLGRSQLRSRKPLARRDSQLREGAGRQPTWTRAAGPSPRRSTRRSAV